MNLSQYNVDFSAAAHKGGKSYIARIIDATRTAMLRKHKHLGHTPLFEVLAKHVGLANEGMDDKWFEICANRISQGIKRPEQLLWRRIGRFIQDNKCWPTTRMISQWPEYESLVGTDIDHMLLPPAKRKRDEAVEARAKAKKEEREKWKAVPLPTAPKADPQHVSKKADSVGLNFRVSPEFAFEFKEGALLADKKQNAYLAELLYGNKQQRDTILSMEQRILCLEDKLNDVWEMIDMATSPKGNGRVTWLGKILGEGAAEQKEEK